MKQTCLILLLFVSVFFLSSTSGITATEKIEEEPAGDNNSVTVLQNVGISSVAAEKMLGILSDAGLSRADFAKETGDGLYRVWVDTAYYDFALFDNGVISCTDYGGNEIYKDDALNTKYEDYIKMQKYNVLEGITDPIKRGNAAEVRLHNVEPGTSCKIKVKYASGSVSKAKGLEEKIADENGKVSWKWKISSRTGPGVAVVTVSCEEFTYSYEINVTE